MNQFIAKLAYHLFAFPFLTVVLQLLSKQPSLSDLLRASAQTVRPWQFIAKLGLVELEQCWLSTLSLPARRPPRRFEWFAPSRNLQLRLSDKSSSLSSMPKASKPQPDRLEFERDLWSREFTLVAGVDEAGRGPLAGPVVAAAVILPATWVNGGFDARLVDLNDSKQLTEAQRENFFQIITTHPDLRYAIAIVDTATIDRINILQATHRAMNEALAQLQPQPQHVLVDGRPVKSMTLPQTALVKGDSRSYSIAAASVFAKVTRDRLMLEFDKKHPGYGFAVHKGYGVPQHLAAIEKLGPCPIHRMSFAPFKQK